MGQIEASGIAEKLLWQIRGYPEAQGVPGVCTRSTKEAAWGASKGEKK